MSINSRPRLNRMALSTLVSGVLLCHGTFAQEDNAVVGQMNMLISQGQFQQAYALGQQNLFDL